MTVVIDDDDDDDEDDREDDVVNDDDRGGSRFLRNVVALVPLHGFTSQTTLNFTD